MRILQLDVNNITYEPVKPEAKLYDDVEKKPVSIDDVLVLLLSVEKNDTVEMTDKAIQETDEFLKKLARKKLLIYPYAHLSNDLATPEEALKIINYMVKHTIPGVEVFRGPFGWNKKLKLDIKGHPLAEQSRAYYPAGTEEKIYKKTRPVSVNTSLVKKSSWAGLPDTDHRTIGEHLDLYSFQEVSPGMTYWHPSGYLLFKELMRYIREKLDDYGYKEIATPAFANIALWHVSGHDEHYKDNMFLFDVGGQEYGLKPMNCPSTFMIYKARTWSYKELPLRLADFDKLYRNEITGALTGLFRVRELTQDDAHLFVREDQVESELNMVIQMVDDLYKKFGLEYNAKLSTMPDKHAGEKSTWDKAMSQLAAVLDARKMKYEIKDKEGAFYGPKIDFDIKDSMGREWQCATVQLDYQLPKRFKLEYVGEDGKQHTPVVIHRVIYGTLERFMGVLTEHLQGKFPTWLSPVQARVITISEQSNNYAESVYNELKKHRIRAEISVENSTLEHKIREAILQKIPYIVVIGKKEQDGKTVTVRSRSGKQKFGIPLDEFIANVRKEIDDRAFILSY